MKNIFLEFLIVLMLALPEIAAAGSVCPGPVRDLTLIALDGNLVKIECSDYNALVVNLWATWCAPCRVEIPHLVELAHEYKSRKVKVIGISMDSRVSRSVKSFVENQKITYPIYVGNTDELLATFSVGAVPATLIFDRKGILYEKLVGLYSKEEMRRIIEKALDKN